MVVRNFLCFTFCPTGPLGAGNHEIQGFKAFFAQDGVWHLETSRAWAENGKKRKFPVIGFPKSKRTLPRYPGWLSATLCFARTAPHGQEIAKYGHFGHFGPWHLKKSRGWAKNGKMQFPGASGGTLGREIRTPHNFLQESAQLFDSLRFS